MANSTFEVTVIDQWPKFKLLINKKGVVREEGPYMYDIAASQFTPAVQDTLQAAVNETIKQRKGER